MDIVEVFGSKPVSCRSYKTNTKEREVIRYIVQEWKDHGIVAETRSPDASPVLLVQKTGKPKLVVDYRRLNNQTIKDHFPLPNIDAAKIYLWTLPAVMIVMIATLNFRQDHFSTVVCHIKIRPKPTHFQ